jgi:hypothetical protein
MIISTIAMDWLSSAYIKRMIVYRRQKPTPVPVIMGTERNPPPSETK